MKKGGPLFLETCQGWNILKQYGEKTTGTENDAIVNPNKSNNPVVHYDREIDWEKMVKFCVKSFNKI